MVNKDTWNSSVSSMEVSIAPCRVWRGGRKSKKYHSHACYLFVSSLFLPSSSYLGARACTKTTNKEEKQRLQCTVISPLPSHSFLSCHLPVGGMSHSSRALFWSSSITQISLTDHSFSPPLLFFIVLLLSSPYHLVHFTSAGCVASCYCWLRASSFIIIIIIIN